MTASSETREPDGHNRAPPKGAAVRAVSEKVLRFVLLGTRRFVELDIALASAELARVAMAAGACETIAVATFHTHPSP